LIRCRLSGSGPVTPFTRTRITLIGAAWLVIRHAAPLAPLLLLVPGLAVLFVRMVRPATPLQEKARHV